MNQNTTQFRSALRPARFEKTDRPQNAVES